MTLTDADHDRIAAALERAKRLGTVKDADLCRFVFQSFRGLYTLEQVEAVNLGVMA